METNKVKELEARIAELEQVNQNYKHQLQEMQAETKKIIEVEKQKMAS